MTKKLQVFKCEICGNMVEVIHTGAGELVCCGQNMTLMEENTVDAAKEKHVPVKKNRCRISGKSRQCATPHGGETSH